jgi:hypothetical protein
VAFLRGIERRAWVFALTQCGDPVLARHAVASALREFVAESPGEPIARWPLHVWTALLRQPDLLTAREDANSPLASLTVGPRAALLLRLVAGLDFPHAAEVLGVGEPAYRFALSRALEDWARLDPSPGALEALRDRLLAQVKQLAPAQADDLARIRSEALQPLASPAVETVVAPSGGGRTRRWPTWAWAALATLALAFIATFVWPLGRGLAPNATEPLPPETAAASPAYDDAAIVTHPDYALLAASADRAAIDDAALLSWIAAGSPSAAAAAKNPLQESVFDESAASDIDVEATR